MSVTETDLAVAAAIYPILVECAREKPTRTLTYGQLINEAKVRCPNEGAVHNAIPVSLGRRLDVVRMFLNEKSLPDLTVVVVNASTGEVGSAFGANPDVVRVEVSAFDWSSVSEQFTLHIAGLRKSAEARKRPKLTRDQAKAAMSSHYLEYSAAYPKEIIGRREEIIALICDGLPAEDAFLTVAAS